MSPSALPDRSADDRAAPGWATAEGDEADPPAAVKGRLRRAVYARRRDRLTTDPAAVTAAGPAVRDVLLASPEVAALEPGATVAAYLELSSEVPAGAIRAALLVRGVRLILPVLLPDGDLDWMVASAAPTTAAAAPQSELLGLDTITRATVVLLPGVAGDRTGNRLGRGGGSYDRALARLGGLPARERPWTCLLLFADEVLTEVPVDAHDVGVDALATPAGLLRTMRRPGAD